MSPNFDLEMDLIPNKELCLLVAKDEKFAQNLYCALSNRLWMKLDMWEILTENHWSCSWRRAGEIVSKMRHSNDSIEPDYMEYYCSGIGVGVDDHIKGNFVAEGVLTDQVELELKKIGWISKEYEN